MPTTAGNPRQTYAWRTLSNRRLELAAAADEPCCRCGQPIDYNLPRTHRNGATCDHLDALAHGGNPYPTLDDLGPAHRRCNSRHGGQLRRTRPPTPTPPTKITNSSRPQTPIFQPGNRNPVTGDLRVSVGSPSVAFEGGSFNPPRILTPPPADAVGSLAEGWVPWFESTLGITLREWQRLVLWHGLLIDESGRLVYRDLVVTAPRQEGKSWLILALASARAAHAGVFGEPQEVLHVANKLVAARRIHTRAWRWAESVGLTIKKSEGRESLVWPDDSHWTISSIGAIWGASSSTAIVDEAWEITPDVVDEALMPTLVERVQPQLWLMSTANPATTPVVPLMRRKAIRGAPRTFLAEWSMPPDADVHDPEVWRSASPHWTPQRLELMAAAQDSRGFAEQWLNRWPPIREDERSEGFPAGWDNCPRTVAAPLPGLFGAVETSQDRSLFGVAVAVADPVAGGRVSVWSRSFRSLEDAASQLAAWAPSQLLVGMTLRDAFPGRWVVHPVGVKETRLATPVVADVVARHRLWHDGDVDTATQVASARTSLTEGGIVLSATRSQGPISSVKAVTWAVYAAENPDSFAAPRPRIW